MTRLNLDLKGRLELRSAELTLGAADLAIKETVGLESLRKQQELAENRLKATLADLEAAHQQRLQDLAASFAEKKKLQDDMFLHRIQKLKAEAAKAQPPQKLPLDKFISKHLLETFSNPQFVRKALQREERKAQARSRPDGDCQPLPASKPTAAVSSSAIRPRPLPLLSKKNSFIENRSNAFCRDDSHKSSQHYAERLKALEDRHAKRYA